jgi:hypothetical protein
MARARAKHAASWRFRVFCVPVGLVSWGLLLSIEIGHQAGGLPIPFSPIVAGAVLSRSLAGITAGRVAALFAAAIGVYALAVVGLNRDEGWVFGSATSLIAVCLNGASFRRWISPNYRSACLPADEPQTHHIPKQ